MVLRYLTTRDESLIPQIRDRITGLRLMFGPQQAPPELNQLDQRLQTFLQNKTHPEVFLSLIKAFEALPAISAFDEAEMPSFDAIFESYKADQGLNALVDELVRLIERIISEGDSTLSARIAREFEVIVNQLKKRQRYSLYELQSWVDLGARALISYIEAQTGSHGLEVAYEAVKLSFKIKRKLMEQYTEAQKKLIQGTNLIYIADAVEHIPELQVYEQKYLEGGPSVSDQPQK